TLESILDFAKAYLQERRHAVSLVAVLFILCINYFDFSLFLRINLAVFSFGGLVVFYYFTALTQKRSNNGNFLSYEPTNRIEVHEHEYK
ncbi:hypothetical protein MJD09_12675, partial [bacterium]|nr:hypothetical protein [bacterium]